MTRLSQNDLDWFAARLSLAVYDTNTEYYMGIADLKEQLKHVKDINALTMRYGDGGTQIFKIGDIEVELPAMASNAEIEAALTNPFEFSKKKLNPPLQMSETTI